jgi:hypothetical protein
MLFEKLVNRVATLFVRGRGDQASRLVEYQIGLLLAFDQAVVYEDMVLC